MKLPSTEQAVELEIIGTPWTPGPWTTGPAPHGHCRIYSIAETHAIARTYGTELNGIPTCELTGPQNAADAALIAEAPQMAQVCIKLQAAYMLIDTEHTKEFKALLADAMSEATSIIERLACKT